MELWQLYKPRRSSSWNHASRLEVVRVLISGWSLSVPIDRGCINAGTAWKTLTMNVDPGRIRCGTALRIYIKRSPRSLPHLECPVLINSLRYQSWISDKTIYFCRGLGSGLMESIDTIWNGWSDATLHSDDPLICGLLILVLQFSHV